MKVLLIGSGGREHALAKKIKENKTVTEIFALPGNGGMAEICTCVPIDAKDIEGIFNWVKKNHVDFAVIGPDDPLVLGIVDKLSELNIPCFGPNKKAAVIEGSKAFAKELMKNNNIPTANYEIFDNPQKAIEYIKSCHVPLVIKADGLALGKGVIIAKSEKEAIEAVSTIMIDKKFGQSGNKIVIEEFLEGPEVTVLAFTDGLTIKPMISSMDHKAIGENGTGPNTGGMGVIAPNPYYTNEIAKICMETIFVPTIKALNQMGRTFKGCLYFGLMLTKSGPKVIEYNCRFGDPEAQTILPLLKTDLIEIMKAVESQTLDKIQLQWENQSACCVVASSKGYPSKYKTGYEISFPDYIKDQIFISGATIKPPDYAPDIVTQKSANIQPSSENNISKSTPNLVTSGGRVLAVTATAPTLASSIDKAYILMEQVSFDNKYCRSDIGKTALKAFVD